MVNRRSGNEIKGELFRRLGRILAIIILIVSTLELLIRISGIQKSYSEENFGQYVTYYDAGHDSWHFSHQPNDSMYMATGEYEYQFYTNAYGFRERELSMDTCSIRLFVFGDSFTEGMGAAYDSTYPRRLAQLLERDGLDAEVYNMGVSGADPFFNMISLQQHFLKYRPTHVLFTINSSDMLDLVFRGGFERFMNDGKVKYREAPKVHKLYQYSHLFRFFLHKFLFYDATLNSPKNRRKALARSTEEIKSCLDSTYRICREKDIQFMAVSFLMPGEICFRRLNLKSNIDRMDRYEFEYPYIKIDEQYKGSTEKCSELGWRNDGHFKGVGYYRLGEHIYNSVNLMYPDFWSPQK